VCKGSGAAIMYLIFLRSKAAPGGKYSAPTIIRPEGIPGMDSGKTSHLGTCNKKAPPKGQG
jgi:hypothetical protein